MISELKLKRFKNTSIFDIEANNSVRFHSCSSKPFHVVSSFSNKSIGLINQHILFQKVSPDRYMHPFEKPSIHKRSNTNTTIRHRISDATHLYFSIWIYLPDSVDGMFRIPVKMHVMHKIFRISQASSYDSGLQIASGVHLDWKKTW